MKMVMGGETEYAVSARDDRGQIVDQSTLLEELFAHIKQRLGYTSLASRGRFLGNGGLLYVDAGLHLEWATPECTSPFDVVRYLKAGDRLVYDLVMSYQQAFGRTNVFCSRANVDYESGTLWAAHESYMHDVPPATLPYQLTPFLASRVIFAAGGWDWTSPGLRFTMSPRAHFITKVEDRDSQRVRPLFHSKNEPLSNTGSHRLHVACSESLCSDAANVLRFGTTALVLALLERGIELGQTVTLASPVRAMQRFAVDPTFQACVVGNARPRMSALDIQRHYLECAEAHLRELHLPDWAERVCDLWRTTLDSLETDPARLGTTLDWAIKQQLFARQLARRGITWSSLKRWNALLHRLKRTWPVGKGRDVFTLRRVVESHASRSAQTARLTALLARYGFDWEPLADFAAARDQLLELDARFSALGDNGIFNAMEAAGALHHHVGSLDIDRAVTEPPQDTRAKLRGAIVRRLTDARTPYAAEWTSVFDNSTRRSLDLRNPFEIEEHWVDEWIPA